jgi:hypothetical protein
MSWWDCGCEGGLSRRGKKNNEAKQNDPHKTPNLSVRATNTTKGKKQHAKALQLLALHEDLLTAVFVLFCVFFFFRPSRWLVVEVRCMVSCVRILAAMCSVLYGFACLSVLVCALSRSRHRVAHSDLTRLVAIASSPPTHPPTAHPLSLSSRNQQQQKNTNNNI